MKRRFFSVFMSLALCLMLFPATVWAEAEAPVLQIECVAADDAQHIITISEENASDVLGDLDTGATVTYDFATNTLTLNKANIQGITAIGIKMLNIVLVGENIVKRTDTEKNAIYSDGSVTMTGDGSINATAINWPTVWVKDDLTISNGTIQATSSSTNAFYTKGSITISDGSITAETKDSPALYSCGDIIVSGGKVNPTSTAGNGINAKGQFTMTGGSITVTTYGEYPALQSTENMSITGGTVNAKSTGGNAINSEGTITITGGNVTATASGGFPAVWSTGNISITGGAVKVTSENASGVNTGAGLTVGENATLITSSGPYPALRSQQDMTISGGRVTATSTEGNGIFAENSAIQITNGAIVNAMGGMSALSADATIAISDSTVTATVTTSGNGIYTLKNLTINNSIVTAEGKGGYCDLRGDEGVTVSNSTVETKTEGLFSQGEIDIIASDVSAQGNIRSHFWIKMTDAVIIDPEGCWLGEYEDSASAYGRSVSYFDEDSNWPAKIVIKSKLRTITFDPNGGNVEPTSAKTNADGKLASLPTPTRNGYTFDGWFTAAENGETVTIDSAFTEDATVYACWTKTSSKHTYRPEITNPDGGTVTVSPKSPEQGDTVIVIPKPEDGKEIDKITVTDKNGDPVDVTKNPDGSFSFKQPSGKVTITVTFKPVDETPCDGGETCPCKTFTDLDNTLWYHEAADYVLTHSLMDGYGNGKFGPNDTLSRGMVVQILYNLDGRPSAEGSGFSDVPDEMWCADAVQRAADKEITSGYGDGTFGPDVPISREQLAAMLYRYANSPAVPDLTLTFTDADKVSNYAENAVRWAVSQDIINGKTDNMLDPKGQATRVEVAAMLMRYCKNLK